VSSTEVLVAQVLICSPIVFGAIVFFVEWRKLRKSRRP